MSRKPTIKISYPEASSKALQLTEAMVKRAPGERVVRTESKDPVFQDGGDLFLNFIRCKTQTGVDLTLTLNPSSMDYALETLICPNLTADERKQILGDSASGDDLLPSSASAEKQTAPDQKEQMEVGRIDEQNLKSILGILVDAIQLGEDPQHCIQVAVDSIVALSRIGSTETQSGEQTISEQHLKDIATHIGIFLAYAQTAPVKKISKIRALANQIRNMIDIQNNKDKTNPFVSLCRICQSSSEAFGSFFVKASETFEEEFEKQTKENNPSWEDVKREARQMQASARRKKSAAPEADNTTDKADRTDKADKTDEAEMEQDGEIEPGLLNDTDDVPAPAGEVMGHDE